MGRSTSLEGRSLLPQGDGDTVSAANGAWIHGYLACARRRVSSEFMLDELILPAARVERHRRRGGESAENHNPRKSLTYILIATFETTLGGA